MPEEGKTDLPRPLASRFQFVDGELAGKQYLMGEHFSVADGYLYTVTRWTKPMNIDLRLPQPARLPCSAWAPAPPCRKP
jgi:glutathione S-transferase